MIAIAIGFGMPPAKQDPDETMRASGVASSATGKSTARKEEANDHVTIEDELKDKYFHDFTRPRRSRGLFIELYAYYCILVINSHLLHFSALLAY